MEEFDLDDLVTEKIATESDAVKSEEIATPDFAFAETAFGAVTSMPESESGEKMEIDPVMASMGASFYVEVLLPELASGLGEYFAESEKNHLPSQKVMKSYQKITEAALQSGGISLPTPTQMFYICTLIIAISVAASIFMERKKVRAKKTEKNNRIASQFGDATKTENTLVKSRDTVTALVENEAKRSNFEIDDTGRYTRDANRVYIPMPDRFLKPSETVKKMIDEGMSNKDIKKKLNE